MRKHFKRSNSDRQAVDRPKYRWRGSSQVDQVLDGSATYLVGKLGNV